MRPPDRVGDVGPARPRRSSARRATACRRDASRSRDAAPRAAGLSSASASCPRASPPTTAARRSASRRRRPSTCRPRRRASAADVPDRCAQLLARGVQLLAGRARSSAPPEPRRRRRRDRARASRRGRRASACRGAARASAGACAPPRPPPRVPTRDAGLRAAEQLVARERDEVGAARDRLGDGRLVGQAPARAGSRGRRACPSRDRSSSRRRARGRSRRARSGATSAVKPTIAKLRAVDLEQQAGRSDRSRSRSRCACVLFVVPTSTSVPPDSARISGRRNEPPISISSPRETTISLPDASAARPSTVAAALLFTTIASSAPVSSRSSARRWSWREPRSPLREVVLEVRVAARDLVDRGARRGGERRAAEVRVQHDAGRVDHAAQRRAARAAGELGDLGRRDRRAVRRAGEDRLATRGDRAARRLDHRPARRVAERRGIVGERVNAQASLASSVAARRHATAGSTVTRPAAAYRPRLAGDGRPGGLRAARRAADPRDRRDRAAALALGPDVHLVRRVHVHGVARGTCARSSTPRPAAR